MVGHRALFRSVLPPEQEAVEKQEKGGDDEGSDDHASPADQDADAPAEPGMAGQRAGGNTEDPT